MLVFMSLSLKVIQPLSDPLKQNYLTGYLKGWGAAGEEGAAQQTKKQNKD